MHDQLKVNQLSLTTNFITLRSVSRIVRQMTDDVYAANHMNEELHRILVVIKVIL